MIAGNQLSYPHFVRILSTYPLKVFPLGDYFFTLLL